ncbi:MAG: hypothetical protein Kow00127_09950 [Bacteroidales bacterium]
MKKGVISHVLLLFVLFLFSGLLQAQFTVTPASAGQMVPKLAGPGIRDWDNLTFQGDDGAAGIFTGGCDTVPGFDYGVVLSTGLVETITGENSEWDVSANLGQPGHPTLNMITTGYWDYF